MKWKNDPMLGLIGLDIFLVVVIISDRIFHFL